MSTTEAPPGTRGLDSLRIARPERGPRQRRGFGLAALGMIVALGGIVALGYAFHARPAGREIPVRTITVAAGHRARPDAMLSGTGYIVTRHKYIVIGTKVLGQIVSEPIEEGQHIQSGDLLAKIDDRDYQAQLRQAVAVRDLSEAALHLATLKWERSKLLIKSGAISRDTYDTDLSAVEVGKAALARDIAAVDYATFEVSQCVITSPINGVVLKKYRELGDTINFGGEIQAGGGATDIAELADTGDMRAEVDINEADIARIAIGSPARVTPDAYPERIFEASVVKIYPAADRQKGTIKVEVHLLAPDLQIIKPEMSARVSFLEHHETAGTEPASIVIPPSAVQREANQSYVWVVRDGAARQAKVRCGNKTETGVEILDGLAGGDTVILDPGAQIQEGRKVSVQNP